MLRVLVLAAAFLLAGCRSYDKVSHSVETTYRTVASPWDDKVIDKVDVSITVRKAW